MNQDTREVTRGGEQINLTATQFDLLRYLMENAKRVVSKSQILDNVWNYDFGGQANIVELYISYLRKKIDVGREPMIHTVRGAGYAAASRCLSLFSALHMARYNTRLYRAISVIFRISNIERKDARGLLLTR